MNNVMSDEIIAWVNDYVVNVARLDHEKPKTLVYRIDARSLYDLLRMWCRDIFVPGATSHIHRDEKGVLLEYNPTIHQEAAE